MRVGSDVGHVHHRTDGGLRSGEGGEHLGLRSCRTPRDHHGLEFVTVLHPPVERGEARIVGHTEHRHHPGRHAVGTRRQADPFAVAATVRATRHRVRQPGTQSRLRLAGEQEQRDQRPHDLEQALEQAHVDHLTGAAVQRHHRREGGHQPGQFVGERDGRQQRLAVRFAADRAQSGHDLGDGGEPGTGRVRAGLPEAGHASDHERRIALVEHVGPESHAFEGAGTEVLDEHLCVVDESEEHVAIGRILQVESDRTLVAVHHLPPQARMVAWVAPRHVAQAVAGDGPLHLDHVGTEVGQVAGRVRAGQHRRDVEHPEVAERSRTHRRLMRKQRSSSSPSA